VIKQGGFDYQGEWVDTWDLVDAKGSCVITLQFSTRTEPPSDAFHYIVHCVNAHDALTDRIAELERSEEKLIIDRDEAEEYIGKMFDAVFDRYPEWSNMYGYSDAVEEVEDRIAELESDPVIYGLQRIAELEAVVVELGVMKTRTLQILDEEYQINDAVYKCWACGTFEFPDTDKRTHEEMRYCTNPTCPAVRARALVTPPAVPDVECPDCKGIPPLYQLWEWRKPFKQPWQQSGDGYKYAGTRNGILMRRCCNQPSEQDVIEGLQSHDGQFPAMSGIDTEKAILLKTLNIPCPACHGTGRVKPDVPDGEIMEEPDKYFDKFGGCTS
jgi:hypothetical protein